MIENIEVKESLGTSDHNAIEFLLTERVHLKDSSESVPDFRRANYPALRKYFSEIDWSTALGDEDAEKQWQGFSDLVRNACSRFGSTTETSY